MGSTHLPHPPICNGYGDVSHEFTKQCEFVEWVDVGIWIF
jgi:hypothetical protein